MSCFVTSPAHVGILAALCVSRKCVISEYRNNDDLTVVHNVAGLLMKENIRSVAARYPNDKDGQRPGLCLLDAELVEGAQLYAAHYLDNDPKAFLKLTAVEILSLINCIKYQSNETDDWNDTLAYRQLDWLLNTVIRGLPGYDDAPYEYSGRVESIDVLLFGEAA